MRCQINGPHKDQFNEDDRKVVLGQNILTWQNLSIGLTPENLYVSKSSWPKCSVVEIVKRKGYCPITRKRHEELIQFALLIAETDWVKNYPILLYRLTKIDVNKLPNKIPIYLYEDGPIEALSLRPKGELDALYKTFEASKLANSWMIRALKTSLNNEFIQAVANAYFNNVMLPKPFQGAW